MSKGTWIFSFRPTETIRRSIRDSFIGIQQGRRILSEFEWCLLARSRLRFLSASSQKHVCKEHPISCRPPVVHKIFFPYKFNIVGPTLSPFKDRPSLSLQRSHLPYVLKKLEATAAERKWAILACYLLDTLPYAPTPEPDFSPSPTKRTQQQ